MRVAQTGAELAVLRGAKEEASAKLDGSRRRLQSARLTGADAGTIRRLEAEVRAGAGTRVGNLRQLYLCIKRQDCQIF